MSEETTDKMASLTETALELTQAPNSIFRRALFGGYKTHDVDHYVERAAEVLESLIEENKEFRVQFDTQEQRENDLRTALSSALNFSDHLMSAARREASTLLQDSRDREEELAEETDSTPPASLAEEIEALRAQRDRLSAELNAALDSHIRLMTAVETNSMTELNRARANSLINDEQMTA